MKIKSIAIKNFRGYSKEVRFNMNNLTVIIGKNDVGKSSVLDMLDIFFNGAKIDKTDVNTHCRQSGDFETVFTVRFTDLPATVDIDSGNVTTLQDEYLTIGNNEIEVVKKYVDGGKEKVFIRTMHPNNPKCCDLLKKKNADLKKEVDKLKLDCDRTRNATMRKAIWKQYDLQMAETELDVSTKDGDIKSIWEKLQQYLPVYSLFKSDRSNDDKDSEVQDPLKVAVKQLMREEELSKKLNEISDVVQKRLQDVASRTMQKLQEMNSEVANSLCPVLPPPKWEDIFKGISITGDENIPISKRGSGVRRLILLNFFRAEAERLQGERQSPNVVYAVEEPETSQHADFQLKLIDAFKGLSKKPAIQVVLTTHSSHIVKELQFGDLRMVKKDKEITTICSVEPGALPYPSLNEVNYVAFDGEASVEYHDELYGHLQSIACEEDVKYEKEQPFENWLIQHGIPQTKQWIRIKKGQIMPAHPCTLPTYVRNSIHHPENTENEPYLMEELKQSIETMRKVFETFKTAGDQT